MASVKGQPKFCDKWIDTPDARTLFDFEMIKYDLLFAKSCFERLSGRARGVTFSPFSIQTDPKEFNDWCMFAAAGLHYRKCFKSGVRVRIDRPELERSLTHNRIILHDALVDIVDKHFAHSVNEMEVGNTCLQIEIHEDARIERKSIGSQVLWTGPLNSQAYGLIVPMIAQILSSVVEVRLSKLRKVVSDQLDQLTDEEITALPERELNFIEQPKYGASREYVKSQRRADG